ncbi:MAG: insulinase family protein [Oscillatoriales cyanobacterium]|nr:MAG: insulinase family protein [Oscillatoriales cyanobacterium]
MRSVNFWGVWSRGLADGWWRVVCITLMLGVLAVGGGLVLPSAALADRLPIQSYIDRTIANVTDFTLENGMRFIVLERHESPTVSFITYANVGGVDEPPGKTGIAHFLEHLAFKGTTRIGTTDYAAEQPLLDRLDELHREIKRKQAAGAAIDPDALAALKAEFEQVETAANSYAIQNEFGQIVQQAGGVGLNATTSADATRYFYSFPSNKLELWMSLESERFLDPVFREFYKEQQVILEERRLRTDNSPIGATIEAFLATAFTTHPYRHPTIGFAADIEGLSRDEVQAFFETYYVPNNLTVAIVGDVNPKQVRRLAKTYFGRYPAGPTPPPVTQVEPEQTAERSIEVRMQSEPWYIEGYHRPSLNHPDNATYDAIASILSNGRTSRLYSALVQGQQVALYAEGFNGFPGDRYPNLMLFYGLTAPGHSVDEVQAALHEEIQRIASEPVSEIELDRAKTQARASLLRSLNSNSGMASSLVNYQAKTGDWRNLFEQLKAIDAVTAADILRVARATFTDQNRTIARLLPLDAAANP